MEMAMTILASEIERGIYQTSGDQVEEHISFSLKQLVNAKLHVGRYCNEKHFHCRLVGCDVICHVLQRAVLNSRTPVPHHRLFGFVSYFCCFPQQTCKKKICTVSSLLRFHLFRQNNWSIVIQKQTQQSLNCCYLTLFQRATTSISRHPTSYSSVTR